MATGVSLTRIVVIESLAPNEVATGQMNAEWIASLVDDHDVGIGVDLVRTSGAQGFSKLLYDLTDRARRHDDWPMLHIECHGSKSTGLWFADGSNLPWDSLAALLTDLNLATQFNLPVVLSACFGAHLTGQYSPVKPAPAFGIVAPSHTIEPAEILAGFRIFYSRFAETSDLGRATSTLAQSQISDGAWFSKLAEHWYEQLIVAYARKHCTRKAIRHWARTLAFKLRSAGTSALVRDLERELSVRCATDLTGKYFDRFFCLHDIQHNTQRFASARERVQTQIASLRATGQYVL